MEFYDRKFKSNGSALILTVVLTVLLSVVGMMFIMTARMDNISTSAVADSKTLDFAVNTVVELIGEQLVLDSPGVDIADLDYYDYPDANNAFLASIEPYVNDSNVYCWRQISDVTEFLKNHSYARQDVDVEAVGLSGMYVEQYPEITVDSVTSIPDNISADADGDGIADSKWILLDDVRSEKGTALYAAIRVIDNSGLLNINTAYKFDPTSSQKSQIDGSSQMQVNLAGLLKDDTADADTDTDNELERFQVARYGGVFDDAVDWPAYNDKMIWDMNLPIGLYAPYDIFDELELRYRYCLDSYAKARIESDPNFDETFDNYGLSGGKYYGTGTNWTMTNWKSRITDSTDIYWDRRHLFTTLNLDRVIDPVGNKMFSLWADRTRAGAITPQELYDKIVAGIDIDNLTYLTTAAEKDDRKAWLAQIVANIMDTTDDDAEVTVVNDDLLNSGKDHYGFERPFIYLSEVTRNFRYHPTNYPATDTKVYQSYAIELRKNFRANDDFDLTSGAWRLEISGGTFSRTIPITPSFFNLRGGNYYVHIFEDSLAPLRGEVVYSDLPEDGAIGVDPDIKLDWGGHWDDIFLGYDLSGNPIIADHYDVYFGDSETAVEDATRTDQSGLISYEEAITTPSYQPSTDGALGTPKEYFWRVDGQVNPVDSDYYSKGEVRSFTTWTTKPEAWEDISAAPIVFDADTTFRLYRTVDGTLGSKDILVDEMSGLSLNFYDKTTVIAGVDNFASYQRDIRWGLILKRFWGETEYDLLGNIVQISRTLGHWNDFEYNGTVIGYSINKDLPIRPYHGGFDNIGDISQLFRKTNYLEGILKYQISEDDSEVADRDTKEFPRIDTRDRVMQKIFQYLTLFDPDTAEDDVTAIKGRININTAPISVIKQLPWVTDNRTGIDRGSELAEAIIAFRDKTEVSSRGAVNYSGVTGRFDMTGISDISEMPGFSSIGELAGVITDDSLDIDYRIDYYGLDGRDQFGYPDLSIGRDRYDGYADDLEEENLILARISDLVTVRSDIFTAYILVRLGTDGPQKRAIAILDRSGVKKRSDKVRVLAYQVIGDIK